MIDKKIDLNFFGTQDTVKKVCQALTSNTRSVSFFIPDKDNFTPYTDGKTIFLPRPSLKAQSLEDSRRWWANAFHEISHNDPIMMKDFLVAKNDKLDLSSPPGFIHNLVVDYSTEHNRYGEFKGRDFLFGNHHAQVMTDWDKDIYGKHSENKDAEALKALKLLDIQQREEWQPQILGKHKELYDVASEHCKNTFDSMQEYKEEYHNLSPEKGGTAEERLAFTKKMIDKFFEMDYEEEKKNGKGKGDGKKSGELRELNGKLSPDDHGNGTKEVTKGKGDKDGDGKITPKCDFSPQEEGKNRDKWKKGSPSGHKGAMGEGGYIPYTADKNLILDFQKGTTLNADPNSDDEMGTYRKRHLREMASAIKPITKSEEDELSRYYGFDHKISNGAKKKLKRLLKISSRASIKYSQTKGKIHGKNLFKTKVPEASHEFKKKVFKKKKEKDILDVSVTILCDFSGSMHWEKLDYAGQALISLMELLKSLQINHELLGFTERWPRLVSLVFKSFEGKKVSVSTMQTYLRMGSKASCQNADGDSILWAWSRIARQKTKRKILIVLSDGSPATDNPGNCGTFTKKVCEQIQTDKRVELYGIGICDSSVKRFYKDYDVINSPEQIENALIKVLQKKILNR